METFIIFTTSLILTAITLLGSIVLCNAVNKVPEHYTEVWEVYWWMATGSLMMFLLTLTDLLLLAT